MNLGRARRHIRFALPQVVAWDAFETVLETLAKESGESSLELDFSKVLHVQYIAMGRFAERLRKLERGFRPIALTGLDPYVLQIVEFALAERDWDLFVLGAREESVAGVSGGIRSSRGSALSGERIFAAEPSPFLGALEPTLDWEPCLN